MTTSRLTAPAQLDPPVASRGDGGPARAAWREETGATLADLLDRAAAVRGHHTFLEGPWTLSYAEAAAVTRKVAASLLELGVRSGDRVLVAARNRVETPLICLAAARIGAVFVVLHGATKPYGAARIHRQVEPRVAILDATTAGLAAAMPGTPVLELEDTPDACGGSWWAEALRHPEAPDPRPPVHPASPACLIFTSGSTGEPLGVVRTHDNVLFSTWAIQRRLAYRRDDVVGLFLPLSFDYGLYQIFLAALAGASVLVQDPGAVGPDLTLRLRRHGVSVLPVVPTLLAAVLLLLERGGAAPGVLRMITNTGEHLSAAHVAEVRRRLPGVALFPMYGLTECKRVSILLPGELAAKPGSVGRPLPGTEVFVAGEDGTPLPAESEGELVVRGPHVSPGYWRAEEETRRRFRRPHAGAPPDLYTADVGRVDRDGFVYFVRRRDALLKHKGFRISPLETEELARDLPEVLEAALVKEDAADRLHLFVTVRDGALTVQRLAEHLAAHLEPEKVPERISIVPELPRTANHKVDRRRLAAWSAGRNAE